ncbi:MAG: DUF4340 domain-containing protein, partial [Armatimonadetes bacterium]|nr:DUF4340 domain-containing protein [Armatimonadota bacterium]
AKLTISTKSGNLALEKAGADWSLGAPLKSPAETTEVDTLLGKVAELKADKFVDDKPSDLHMYSLDKAWIQVDLWKTGGKRPITLFIGKRSSTDTGKVFAMTSTDKPVFLLPDTMLTDLKKSAQDLRRKNVVDVNKDDVKTFTLTNQFGSFGVEKVGNDWKLFKPNAAKADGSTVDSLLYAVQDLKADEFIDSPQPLSAYGLDKPQMEFAVTAKSGSAKLLIGKATSDKTAVFAKADPGTTVCKVPSSILDSLKKNLNDLRDKTVVKFDRKDLDQLSILREGKTLTIAHTGKDKWEITQPEKAEVDSSKLSSTLYTLETLSADSIVAELPSDQQQAAAKLAYYGLDKPRVQVDLTIKKQKPVTVLVGKRTQSGDKVFFMRKGDNTVYTKSEYLLIDLEKEVKDLKK